MSIFENCVVDLDVLHLIGKKIVNNNNYKKRIKHIEQSKKVIKQLDKYFHLFKISKSCNYPYKYNFNYTFDGEPMSHITNNCFNYFYNLLIVSKKYKNQLKFKIPSYICRKKYSVTFHDHYYTKNPGIYVYNDDYKIEKANLEFSITNKELIKIWCYKYFGVLYDIDINKNRLLIQCDKYTHPKLDNTPKNHHILKESLSTNISGIINYSNYRKKSFMVRDIYSSYINDKHLTNNNIENISYYFKSTYITKSKYENIENCYDDDIKKYCDYINSYFTYR